MTRNTTVDARMSAIEAQVAAILAAVQGQQAAPPAKSAHERKVDGLVKARAVLAANRAAAKGQTAPKATKRPRQTETANGQVVPVDAVTHILGIVDWHQMQRNDLHRQATDTRIAAKVPDIERRALMLFLPRGQLGQALSPVVVRVAQQQVAVLSSAPELVGVAQTFRPHV